MTTQLPDRILIVDNESDTAVILALRLKEAGYLTDWAADSQTGEKLFMSNEYALVLLDTRLPGTSGAELLRHLCAVKRNSSVIMMSAHGNENLVADYMREGAVDYIAKPLDIDDLLHRVERALANRRTLLEKSSRDQEKNDFFIMLSHNLKNPITAVIGSIDIMREGRLGPVNSEQVDYLQSAIESCDEVVTMIDNLLDMQRFTSGKMQTKVSQVDPRTLLTTAVRRFSPAAKRDDIVLTLQETPSDVAKIAVDSIIMTRVIENLLGNALKFTPDGGSITLSCRCFEYSERYLIKIPSYVSLPKGFPEAGPIVRISIADTGYGISPEQLATIFERFAQANNASLRGKGGAGLGLAFCKTAVKDFHGCIWAESDEFSGSEFIILLPAIH